MPFPLLVVLTVSPRAVRARHKPVFPRSQAGSVGTHCQAEQTQVLKGPLSTSGRRGEVYQLRSPKAGVTVGAVHLRSSPGCP